MCPVQTDCLSAVACASLPRPHCGEAVKRRRWVRVSHGVGGRPPESWAARGRLGFGNRVGTTLHVAPALSAVQGLLAAGRGCPSLVTRGAHSAAFA